MTRAVIDKLDEHLMPGSIQRPQVIQNRAYIPGEINVTHFAAAPNEIGFPRSAASQKPLKGGNVIFNK